MGDWKSFPFGNRRHEDRRQVSDRRQPPVRQPASVQQPVLPGRGQANEKPVVSSGSDDRPSGRVVHDERGNAVWDWVKETGRIAIESTSRLLRKLEAPDLDFQDEKDRELRIQSDRDAGGGYDPYNQSNRPRRR